MRCSLFRFVNPASGEMSVILLPSREIDKIWDNLTVSSPQLFGDLVFGSFGKGLSGQRLVAVRPKKPGSRQGELVYDIRKSVPLVPSFVVKDGLLYLWTDSGIVTCVDAADEHPGHGGVQHVSGHVVSARDDDLRGLDPAQLVEGEA